MGGFLKCQVAQRGVHVLLWPTVCLWLVCRCTGLYLTYTQFSQMSTRDHVPTAALLVIVWLFLARAAGSECTSCQGHAQGKCGDGAKACTGSCVGVVDLG
jgi:hypothetical protein